MAKHSLSDEDRRFRIPVTRYHETTEFVEPDLGPIPLHE